MGTKVEWIGGYPFVEGINAPRSRSHTSSQASSLPLESQPPVEPQPQSKPILNPDGRAGQLTHTTPRPKPQS